MSICCSIFSLLTVVLVLWHCIWKMHLRHGMFQEPSHAFSGSFMCDSVNCWGFIWKLILLGFQRRRTGAWKCFCSSLNLTPFIHASQIGHNKEVGAEFSPTAVLGMSSGVVMVAAGSVTVCARWVPSHVFLPRRFSFLCAAIILRILHLFLFQYYDIYNMMQFLFCFQLCVCRGTLVRLWGRLESYFAGVPMTLVRYLGVLGRF